MSKTIHLDQYTSLLDTLNVMATSTNLKVISESGDNYFNENANFFTKSFMVMMCAYLESYLKDALMVIIDEMNNRLASIRLPHNLIKWNLSTKELKDSDFLKFEDLKISIKKKDLDEFISGNPFRTISLFKKFGINLEGNVVFESQKDILQTIITKRNNIIHHNDDASDLAFSDIISHIEFIKKYILNIDDVIINQIS